MSNLNTDILKNQKDSNEELLLPTKAHRIEKIEDVYNIPCAPNIFDDPSWVGNENRDTVEKFMSFWKSQGRSEAILRKLLENTHFISKSRYRASVRSLVESIKLNCIKPVILSVPTIPGSISPFEMRSTIDLMGLIEPSSNVYPIWELYEQWANSDFSTFFSQNRSGTFVGIDDIGLGGTTMDFSTPLDHFSRSWSVEYALVGASSDALKHYFSSKYKLRCVHLSYRILSLDEILEPFELEELKTYYNIVDYELHGYTTFRHNTVGDFFFRGLVKDRNFSGLDRGQGIIDFHNIRKLRIKELGLDK